MPNLRPSYELNYDYLDNLHINRNYELYKPKTITGRRFENIQVSEDKCVFRLQDKTQMDIVSLVVLDPKEYNGHRFYEVRWSNSKFEKKQYLTYLFELIIIEFKYTIISDGSHTSPGSKEFWLSLGRKKIFTLFVYNIDSDYKRKYENIEIGKIWGFDTDITDIETKSYVFTDLYEKRKITKDMFDFFLEHIEHIADRSHVRLIVGNN